MCFQIFCLNFTKFCKTKYLFLKKTLQNWSASGDNQLLMNIMEGQK